MAFSGLRIPSVREREREKGEREEEKWRERKGRKREKESGMDVLSTVRLGQMIGRQSVHCDGRGQWQIRDPPASQSTGEPL